MDIIREPSKATFLKYDQEMHNTRFVLTLNNHEHRGSAGIAPPEHMWCRDL